MGEFVLLLPEEETDPEALLVPCVYARVRASSACRRT
jgi:hypothetical protein